MELMIPIRPWKSIIFADTANLATFPISLLRRPVGSLRHERMAIDDALDFLFSGY
jgi:hypothetical protein